MEETLANIVAKADAGMLDNILPNAHQDKSKHHDSSYVYHTFADPDEIESLAHINDTRVCLSDFLGLFGKGI